MPTAATVITEPAPVDPSGTVVDPPADVSRPKMSARFQNVIDSINAGRRSDYPYRLDEQGRLETNITVVRGSGNSIKAELEEIGAKAEGSISRHRVIKAWVPLEQVVALASSPVVSLLDVPTYKPTPYDLLPVKPRDLPITDSLWYALKAHTRAGAVAQGAHFDSAGRVQVEISTDATALNALIDSVAAAGGKVDQGIAGVPIIQAWLPPESVIPLAALSGVRQIDLPDYVVTRPVVIFPSDPTASKSPVLSTPAHRLLGILPTSTRDPRTYWGINLIKQG